MVITGALHRDELVVRDRLCVDCSEPLTWLAHDNQIAMDFDFEIKFDHLFQPPAEILGARKAHKRLFLRRPRAMACTIPHYFNQR